MAGRISEGSSQPLGRSTIFIIDVGQDIAVALIRIRAAGRNSAMDIEQCRLEMIRLIDFDRAQQAVKDGILVLLPRHDGEMHTLDDLIPQLMMAVSMPQGISRSSRDNR
jgi:hypothetical protein